MKRTIAAILAADVAGYSRLIAEDEDDTLRRFEDYARFYRGQVAEVGGRVFNTAGDAILAEFPSAVEALRAAIAIQERLRQLNAEYEPGRRIQFRMGITIGDVVETDSGDMLGDGVNVAARLEGIAEPGGICISRSVHEAIAARITVGFRDIGPQRLKNIPRPVHAFRVVLPSDAVSQVAGRGWRRSRVLKSLAALLLLGIVLGGAAGAWFGWMKPQDVSEDVAAASEPGRADILSASVAQPRKLCFEDQVWLSGVLEPRRELEVGPEAEGLRVVRVRAQPLAEVAAGESLAELAKPDQPSEVVAQVRAPASGIVGRSTAVVGALTSFRAPPLFQIIAKGELELAADMPIRSLDKLKPGQAVTVTPAGLSDIAGKVRQVSNAVDGGTQLGRARVALQTDAPLRQGSFARGVVKVAERCGIGVPLSSIAKGEEGSIVYVSNDGRIEGRLVTTGLLSGEHVEIRSGLAETDAVVTRAGSFVREGDTIRPIVARNAAAR